MCALMLFIACNNHSTSKEIQERATKFPPALHAAIDTLTILKLPFSIDSVFFQKDSLDTILVNTIDIATLKLLTSKMAYDQTSAREKHYINSLLEILTAKSNDTYKDYTDQLEGGMIKDAAASFIGQIHLNDSVGIVVWQLKYISSDSTPSFTGHHVIGSLFMNGKLLSCMHLGNNDQGDDAPMSYEVFQLFTMDENQIISIRNYSKTSENSEILEEDQKHHEYSITQRGFKLMP